MEMKQAFGLALLFIMVLSSSSSSSSSSTICVAAAAPHHHHHHASSSPPSPARMLSGFICNAFTAALKKILGLAPTAMKVILRRSNVKYESGYIVETVFDGSKHGIEPFAVEVLPNGDILLLDSENSCIHTISPPLSRYSRPKLVAGSAQGSTGHVDGKPREARMNHPKGFTVDDKGNIYIADTLNNAIRKIGNAGVTTVAGGKSRRGGHADGPSEDAKFSNDFDVVYISTSCSLLVVDRGNQAIREIQLQFDVCANQNGASFPLGIIVLLGAGLIGYMIGMFQQRLGMRAYYSNDVMDTVIHQSGPYRAPTESVRPPLIPPENEIGRQEDDDEEEGLLTSVGKLVGSVWSSVSDITIGMFSGIKMRNLQRPNQNISNLFHPSYSCPPQESFVFPKEEPPPLEARTPTPRKTYAFMLRDPELLEQLRRAPAYFFGSDGEQQQHIQKYCSSSSLPKTHYQPSSETTEEILFGAVQEADSRNGP